MNQLGNASVASTHSLQFINDKSLMFQARLADVLRQILCDLPTPEYNHLWAHGHQNAYAARVTPFGPAAANLRLPVSPSQMLHGPDNEATTNDDAIFAIIPIDDGRFLGLRGSKWSIYQRVHEGDPIAIRMASVEYVPSFEETDPTMRLNHQGQQPPWYLVLREVGGRDFLHMSCDFRRSYYIYVRVRNNDTMTTYDRAGVNVETFWDQYGLIEPGRNRQ